MAANQRFSLSLEKLDKLAIDVARLAEPRVVKSGEGFVPSFQREGFLEEANKKTLAWSKRFFVLRDSCLLSYDSANVDNIVEPQTCVCLGKCRVQLLDKKEDLDKLVGNLIDCSGKTYCIHITTKPDKEHVLLCASSEQERAAWVDSIKVARSITHANMVKLAVENRVLAEEKGAAQVALQHTTSALAIFSNTDYIQKTPIAGGAEGWLKTSGFKHSEEPSKKGKLFGLFAHSELKKIKKRYCILRDSHLLLYEAGDALLKPRGVMYLVGTTVDMLEDVEGVFRFRCSAPECGDYIDFEASSEKRRRRWMFALKIGARVTYPDFKILMEEHALLASAVMTPRAAAPPAPHQPAPVDALGGAPDPLTLEDIGVQDVELDAGAQQPYDDQGNPMLRDPSGKLVDVNGVEVQAPTPRFSASGAQLDNFNRLLPPGAVPMFTKEMVPIGVGPDGKHYLPDGTVVKYTDPHFDSHGNQLPEEVVKAARPVSQDVSVALKVRARLAKNNLEVPVDVLGRTFRAMRPDGDLVNADGEKVTLRSARGVKHNTGEIVDYKLQAVEQRTAKLVVKVDDGEEEHPREIGTVEIGANTTLHDVRQFLKSEVEHSFPDFLFLFDMAPILKYEEVNHLAMTCLPEVVIRGKELAPMQHRPPFSHKVDARIAEERSKQEEQREFEDIMARVRAGQFLKPVRRSVFE